MDTKPQTNNFGLLAKFSSPETLVSAARHATDAGYRELDAYSPFPVEDLSEAMRLKPSRLPYAVLGGGITGGLLGFFMQVYATVFDYPLNIGGRPLLSWPAYIPITFRTDRPSGRIWRGHRPVCGHPDFPSHIIQSSMWKIL